jgi:hypothetical protein
LLIRYESDAAFRIVQTSRSEEYPEGDFHLAWTRLKNNKFEPITKSNLIEVKENSPEANFKTKELMLKTR